MSFFSKAEPQKVKRRCTGSADVSAANAWGAEMIALASKTRSEATKIVAFLKAIRNPSLA
jgi:hypothetical protein